MARNPSNLKRFTSALEVPSALFLSLPQRSFGCCMCMCLVLVEFVGLDLLYLSLQASCGDVQGLDNRQSDPGDSTVQLEAIHDAITPPSSFMRRYTFQGRPVE